MKILVLSNAAPFIRGGAEELAEHLVHRLNARKGVEAELLRVPFKWNPAERLIEEILLNRKLKLFNVDRVIGMKFPAYLIPHPDKRLWLMHQFRQAYDLYKPDLTHIGFDERGRQIVDIVKTADNACFADSRRIFTISPVVQKRLKTFNGFDAEVLHHPLNDPERFGGGDYGRYIFAGGRVSAGKRQHLLIEAMRFTRGDFKLIVAGPPESADYAQTLKDLVVRHDLSERVELRLGFLPRDEIVGLVNGALACAAAPIDEDSLSYVAMEAFAAGKCMVTTQDAGGLLEIVHDRETGYVTPPQPEALGAVLQRLGDAAREAQTFGRAARALWDRLGITWESRVERLLS